MTEPLIVKIPHNLGKRRLCVGSNRRWQGLFQLPMLVVEEEAWSEDGMRSSSKTASAAHPEVVSLFIKPQRPSRFHEIRARRFGVKKVEKMP